MILGSFSIYSILIYTPLPLLALEVSLKVSHFFNARPVCRAFWPRIGHGLLEGPRLSPLRTARLPSCSQKSIRCYNRATSAINIDFIIQITDAARKLKQMYKSKGEDATIQYLLEYLVTSFTGKSFFCIFSSVF